MFYGNYKGLVIGMSSLNWPLCFLLLLEAPLILGLPLWRSTSSVPIVGRGCTLNLFLKGKNNKFPVINAETPLKGDRLSLSCFVSCWGLLEHLSFKGSCWGWDRVSDSTRPETCLWKSELTYQIVCLVLKGTSSLSSLIYTAQSALS